MEGFVIDVFYCYVFSKQFYVWQINWMICIQCCFQVGGVFCFYGDYFDLWYQLFDQYCYVSSQIVVVDWYKYVVEMGVLLEQFQCQCVLFGNYYWMVEWWYLGEFLLL